MARREVTDCDRCGAKSVASPIRLSFDVDRVPDGAGGMSDVYEHIDLCVKCSGSLLRGFIGTMDHPARRTWSRDVVKGNRGGD